MNTHAPRYRDRPISLDGTVDVLWDRAVDQEDINADHDQRLGNLELRFAKFAGAFAAVAFIGSLAGAWLGHTL